ncbi:protein of unknown function [Pararobbsia alpina]
MCHCDAHHRHPCRPGSGHARESPARAPGTVPQSSAMASPAVSLTRGFDSSRFNVLPIVDPFPLLAAMLEPLTL